MKCEECGRHGDWLGSERGWQPVHEDASRTVRPILECTACGNTQRLR